MKKFIAFLQEREVFSLMGIAFAGMAAVAAVAISSSPLLWADSVRVFYFAVDHTGSSAFWMLILIPAALFSLLVGVLAMLIPVIKLERRPDKWHL